jgi:transposase
VVMEASGVYTDPVYYAMCEQDFTEVAVVNPAHARALRGHKTDAADCRRLAELFECGLLRGSYIPPAELREMRDLTRYRIKTVQARTSEVQRLGKALESAGHQARLGRLRDYRGLGHRDDRFADRRGAPRAGAGGPGSLIPSSTGAAAGLPYACPGDNRARGRRHARSASWFCLLEGA